MTGGFKVQAPSTGNQLLTAVVLEDFKYQSGKDLTEQALAQLATEWTFTAGQLSVNAEDGSQVLLDADSGDITTAKITVTSADGEETFDQPWSLWLNTLTSLEKLKLRSWLAYNNN